MTDIRRHYLRSAIGVACGLLAAVAIIGLLADFGSAPLSGRSTNGEAGRDTAAISPVEPGGESAIMSLHDAPRPMPALQFKDGGGRPLTLADFGGKVVLLNIWATWCGPCREEMPTLDRLQAELGGPDFEVVALSIDRAGIGAVTEFYDEVGVEHLARYIDESGKAVRQLNAVGLPTTLLIDREGREIARHVGPAEWDAPRVVAFLRQHLPNESGALSPGAASEWASGPADRPVPLTAPPQALRPMDLALPTTGNTTLSATNEGTRSWPRLDPPKRPRPL